MSDDSEPTPEEIAKAQALADHMDGLPSTLSEQDKRNLDVLMAMAMDPPAAQIENARAKLQLKPRARRSLRGAVALAIAASIAIGLWFMLGRAVTTPQPGRELLQAEADAVKSGDPKAIDLAMQAYRRELVKTSELRSAEAVHMRADAAIAAGDFAAARTALTSLRGSGGVIERDAWFRLATVELRAGQNEAAVANADRGLALGKPVDVFTVNLLLARAAAYRASGEDSKAIADLHAALVIVDELTTKALE